jgi:predicted nucleotidyltransferase
MAHRKFKLARHRAPRGVVAATLPCYPCKMPRDEPQTRLNSKASALALLGVEGLFVFGSALDERETADSDIDFVADFREGALGLTSFFELEELLGALFSRKIDLTTRDAPAPALRDRVVTNMVRVY